MAIVAACAAAGGVWVAAPARGQHVPALIYTKVIQAQAADFEWDDARKGSLKGTLKFSARRASAPIVVFLQRDGGEGKFTIPSMLKVSQEGAKFEPNFAVLVRGQKAEFLNDEKKEISHNVYFLGALELDLGIFAKGEHAEHEFKDAGEISVHCSIHKNMDGKFFVAPSPAFAQVESDKDAFEIKGVPAGKYKLKTWQKQKRFKDVEVDVTIEADKEASVTVEMAR